MRSDDDLPTALYGVVLLLAALSYTPLQRCLLAAQPLGSRLAEVIGADGKGKVSLGLYLLAAPLALRLPQAALAMYTLVEECRCRERGARQVRRPQRSGAAHRRAGPAPAPADG